MIKVKLSKTYELDNDKFESWCRERGIGKWNARIYIRDKIYEIGEKYLKEEGIINGL